MKEDLQSISRRTLEHYERQADDFWAGTRTHDVSQNYAALLGAIEGAAPFRILDLGCGPGRDLAWFEQQGHVPTGVDGCARFVDMARAHAGVEVLHQDWLELSLGERRFHGVFANASLFHVPTAAISSVMSELHRALLPRGVLFASNPRGANREGWNGERYGCYRELENWRALIEPEGFELVDHYYRPEGLPRDEQPWLATVFRRLERAAPLRSRGVRATRLLVISHRIRRPLLSLALCALVAIPPLLAHADGPEAMVWLKTGGFVRGGLVELVPQDHVTLLLATGETRKIPWTEIDHTSTDVSSPSVSAAKPTPVSSAPAPARKAASTASASLTVLSPKPVTLESRPRADVRAAWTHQCDSPCEHPVLVDGFDLRIAGDGISPSGPFVVKSGAGVVQLDVNPGSSWARSRGIAALLVGLPVALIGGGLIGAGVATDAQSHQTLETAGLITAIVGGVITIASFPLLLSGTTTVRTATGEAIANAASGRFEF